MTWSVLPFKSMAQVTGRENWGQIWVVTLQLCSGQPTHPWFMQLQVRGDYRNPDKNVRRVELQKEGQ